MSSLFKIDYDKPGRGVRKSEPDKKRFFLFLEIYFRKFLKIIYLNLIYILFCLPIVTFGPATAAMTKISRSFIEGKPVFIFSDFWKEFKANFKQGMIIGLIDLVLIVLLFCGIVFYLFSAVPGIFYYILLVLAGFGVILFMFMNFYVYLEMVTAVVTIPQMLKNALILSLAGAKTNILTFLFSGLILVPSFYYFPISLPILLMLTFSTVSMIVCFNSFQYIYKYMVKPYYDIHPELDNPYEPKEDDDSVVFEDTV